MSYEDYRRTQIEDGQLFQDFVVDAAWQAGLAIVQYASRAYQLGVGESRGGIEIKHDKRYHETGNLCIETAEKARPRDGEYTPSGIMRDDHWLYVIGDYDTLFLIQSNFLRGLHATRNYRDYQTPTSQGFLLPGPDAERYAGLILRPNASDKVEQLSHDLEATATQLVAAVNTNPRQRTLFPLGERP